LRDFSQKDFKIQQSGVKETLYHSLSG